MQLFIFAYLSELIEGFKLKFEINSNFMIKNFKLVQHLINT